MRKRASSARSPCPRDGLRNAVGVTLRCCQPRLDPRAGSASAWRSCTLRSVRSFPKRRFTARSFPRHLTAVARTLPRLARSYVKPSLSPALREKVILATTSVNDCRYCTWVHSRVAAAHGVDLDELRALLAGSELSPSDDREALAVLYAQHYAEQRGNPDPELTRRLRDAFGEEDSEELLAYIRGICFANLAGNTLDAVLFRLRLLRA